MKFSLSLAALGILLSSASPMFADNVVNGTLDFNNTTATPQSYNAFTTGYNGTGSGATTSLSGAFSYSDFANTDRAIFSGSTLTITDVETTYGAYPILMTFTNSAFTGFTMVSDNFGAIFGFSGNTFTFNAPETNASGTYTAVFDFTTNLPVASLASTTSVTPEPSSLMLLGTGAMGMLGAVRRRFRA